MGDYIYLAEAANLLGIKPAQLRNWLHRGKVPSDVRRKRTYPPNPRSPWLFNKPDVEQWAIEREKAREM